MKNNSLAQPFSIIRPKTEDIQGMLPIDCFSTAVRDYIRAVSEAYGCPQDFISVACLCVAGVAAGKKVELLTNPYRNYPADFFCLVGAPSLNKTSPLNEVVEVLIDIDRQAEKEHKQKKKKGETDDLQYPQIVADKSTPEARHVILAQGNMVLIHVDELQNFISSFGRYANGANAGASEMSEILSIWSNQDVTINRKTEETVRITKPAMSIIGGVQPELIKKYFGPSDMVESGFTQRFLFCFPEKPNFIKRKFRRFLNEEVRNSWKFIVNQLYSIESRSLSLCADALDAYNEFADENDQQSDNYDPYLAIVRMKMNIHCLRLAVMAHLLSDEWQNPMISTRIMDFSIRICNYFFRQQAERIAPLLLEGIPAKLTKADLIKRIAKEFTIRSQKSLADALGVSQQYINGILRK